MNLSLVQFKWSHNIWTILSNFDEDITFSPSLTTKPPRIIKGAPKKMVKKIVIFSHKSTTFLRHPLQWLPISQFMGQWKWKKFCWLKPAKGYPEWYWILYWMSFMGIGYIYILYFNCWKERSKLNISSRAVV